MILKPFQLGSKINISGIYLEEDLKFKNTCDTIIILIYQVKIRKLLNSVSKSNYSIIII